MIGRRTIGAAALAIIALAISARTEEPKEATPEKTLRDYIADDVRKETVLIPAVKSKAPMTAELRAMLCEDYAWLLGAITWQRQAGRRP